MKDDYVYLFNDAKSILQDKPLETFMDDDKKKGEKVYKVLLLNT